MSSLFRRSNFCQFGGHDASVSRMGLRLIRASIKDNGKVSTWPVCTTCSGYFQANSDSTMFVLCRWARECGETRHLPASLTEAPLKQSLLIQYVDEFLNNIRQKLGNRFPIFLSDLNESEKDNFIRALEQDSTIANIFLTDVKEGAERKSVALKLWVGVITAAKGTRKTYSVAAQGRKRNFSLTTSVDVEEYRKKAKKMS